MRTNGHRSTARAHVQPQVVAASDLALWLVPLTQAQVRQVLDALFAALTEELSQPGGRVEIEHFGVLESHLLPNSAQGKLIGTDGISRQPPSRRLTTTFRASKSLKQRKTN
ncbi:MAG: HU family DNA-binding protein [Chloroflexi bacterium]|nr:HU family DNA-binding protein [Chloroflexota bacterium]